MKFLTRNFRISIFFLLALRLMPQYAFAQDTNELKAALSYNFAKFTQWPDDLKTKETWHLCYIGEQYRAGFKHFNNRALADKLIVINEIVDLQNIVSCHIVYIGSENRKLLPRMFVALDTKPTLTISDIPGFIGIGGMIEITSSDNRLKFKVNLAQLEQSHLQISSKVLKLATEIKR